MKSFNKHATAFRNDSMRGREKEFIGNRKKKKGVVSGSVRKESKDRDRRISRARIGEGVRVAKRLKKNANRPRCDSWPETRKGGRLLPYKPAKSAGRKPALRRKGAIGGRIFYLGKAPRRGVLFP